MSGTKHYRDHLRPPAGTDPYSSRLGTKDTSDQERAYSYAQLRTAMKHLMPENARLQKRVKELERECRTLHKADDLRAENKRLRAALEQIAELCRGGDFVATIHAVALDALARYEQETRETKA